MRNASVNIWAGVAFLLPLAVILWCLTILLLLQSVRLALALIALLGVP